MVDFLPLHVLLVSAVLLWLTLGNPVLAQQPPVGAPEILVNGSTPTSSTIDSATPVQVSLTTSFTGGSIFYTLNGSTPTTASTFYTGPFTASQSATLRAIAFNSDATQSALADPVQLNLPPVVVSILGPGPYYTWTTFAGLAGTGGSTDGTGSDARFIGPHGLAVDRFGNVFVSDYHGHTIRRITPSGVVSTLAGLSGTWGHADGTGAAARFANPSIIAVDGADNVIVGDNYSHTIRRVTPAGVVSTIAGVPFNSGSNDGNGSVARFRSPRGGAVDSAGNIYVAEHDGSGAIRKITPDRVVSTFAGLADSPGYADGTGSAARFNSPHGPFGIDGADNLYVGDRYNQAIRKITPAGVVTTIAGSPGQVGSADGIGNAARFNSPVSAALESTGNLLVVDHYAQTIRRVTPAGAVSTIGGLYGVIGNTDGVYNQARFYNPVTVAVDKSGNVYVTDHENATVRKGVPTSGLPNANLFVKLGDPATFTADVNAGTTSVTSYQWRKNGINIPGATSATYTLASVNPSDLAAYSVVVSNALGVATSSPTALFLNDPTVFQEFYNLDDNQTPAGWSLGGWHAAPGTIAAGSLVTTVAESGVNLGKVFDLPGRTVRVQMEWDGTVEDAKTGNMAVILVPPAPLPEYGVSLTHSYWDPSNSELNLSYTQSPASTPQYVITQIGRLGTNFHYTAVIESNTMHLTARTIPDGATVFSVTNDSIAVDPSALKYMRFQAGNGTDGRITMDNLYVRIETVPVINFSQSGTGGGTLAKSPEKSTYNYGETVTLTATPPRYGTFLGWSDKPADLVMGALRREVYATIPGSNMESLRNAAKFPNSPDIVGTVSSFEAPPNVMDEYGQRLSGLLIPPLSGHYTFYISSDDSSELWLSTDEDPANKVLIAREPYWAEARDWTGLERRSSRENASAPVFLERGKLYYVEALMKEGGSSDNLAVTWRKPGDPVPANGSEPIPGQYLAYRRSWPPTSDAQGGATRIITVGLTNDFTAVFTNAVPLELQVSKVWDKSFGGTGDDILSALQRTSDGGYILGGNSASGVSGNKGLESFGGSDYWVVKTDANGVKQWEKVFGGSFADEFRVLAASTGGGYFLGGYSQSGATGNKSEASYGGDDYWVVKISSSGEKEWDKRFGGTSADYLFALQPSADGGVLLGGYAGSGNSGNKSQAGFGSDDYWVVKLDSAGAKQWDVAFGGTALDHLRAIAPTGDGGYLLAGFSTSGADGNKADSSFGQADYWVIKIDASGNRQWEKSYGGTAHDYLHSATPDGDGGFLLAGVSFSGAGGNKSASGFGGEDYWIVKIDANGNKVWDKAFGGTGTDTLNEVRQAPDGGFLLTGYSDSGVGGSKTEASQGGYDYWVVKVDAAGTKQWDKSFGAAGSDFAFAAVDSTDGGYVVGGYSASNPGGNRSATNYGIFDYWLVKWNSAEAPIGTPRLSINGVGGTNFSFSLSPSPSISLSSSFSGGTIRYTLDGSTPTASSTLYTTAFTLSASATLRAIAFNSGGTQSAIADPVQINLPPVAPTPVASSTYKWMTIAGRGIPQHGGGIGNQARFGEPKGLAIDADGNILVADAGLDILRRVSRAGEVTIAAGFWWTSYKGIRSFQDGMWDQAFLSQPRIIAADSCGNAYFADGVYSMVRRLSPDGMVTTIAGTHQFTGNLDGIGAAARFSRIVGIAVDASGIIFVSDQNGSVLRKVTPLGEVTTVSTSEPISAGAMAIDRAGVIYALGEHAVKKINSAGEVTILAGSRYNPGSQDGTGGNARFNINDWSDLDLDVFGNIYIADVGNHTIRKVMPGGVVTTVAGTSGSSGTADGVGAAARFKNPSGMAVHPDGSVIVSDAGNATIRVIAPNGAVSTLAGLPGVTTPDGPGQLARFNEPTGVALDNAGNLFVADHINGRIRKIEPDGTTTTFAGGLNSSDDGTGGFAYPYQIARDSGGSFFITEYHGHRVRKMTPEGVVTTLAGEGSGQTGYVDGTASAARFRFPAGIAVDAAGNVYVSDEGNHVIRKITLGGVVSTFAGAVVDADGDGSPDGGVADGTGTTARFYAPDGLAFDASGVLYVLDRGNGRIRKVTPESVVTTWVIVPAGGRGLAIDGSGNVFVAQESGTILKITPAGVVTTLAGEQGMRGHVDGVGTAARFEGPHGITVDATGNLYVADRLNSSIRKIAPDGAASTLAGYNRGSYQDGPALQARFNFPQGSTLDSAGNLYVADTHNHAIRKLTPDGIVITVAGLPGTPGSEDGTGAGARFRLPQDVALDTAGNLYVAGDYSIRKINPAGVVSTFAGTSGQSEHLDGNGKAARFRDPRGIAVDSLGNVFVSDWEMMISCVRHGGCF